MRLVVFTDLDGTLLDHDTYTYDAASPALEALSARGVPLILASSKTEAEIAELHRTLGLGAAPAIVENGAGLFDPASAASGGDADYLRIREALSFVPKPLRGSFTGFGDMSEAEVGAATGLSIDAARLAKQRRHSEPGVWTGSDADFALFLETLEPQGVTARRGGRFLTLSLGGTKADRMAEVTRCLIAEVSAALGDAPNDAEMIEAADYGFIIRNDHGPGMPELAGEREGRIRRTELPGPAGWNRAVLGLLEELGLK